MQFCTWMVTHSFWHKLYVIFHSASLVMGLLRYTIDRDDEIFLAHLFKTTLKMFQFCVRSIPEVVDINIARKKSNCLQIKFMLRFWKLHTNIYEKKWITTLLSLLCTSWYLNRTGTPPHATSLQCFSSLESNKPWSIVPKAFLRPRNTATVISPFHFVCDSIDTREITVLPVLHSWSQSKTIRNNFSSILSTVAFVSAAFSENVRWVFL